MQRKIAVKRLSASDLTLFEHHFRHTEGTKQKALNLDVAIFIDRFYPGLLARLDATKDRLPLDLSIYGPGGAGLHNLQRKILKQQKNWRLNGELIYNPPEDDDRYNLLQTGDYAVLEFFGDVEPQSARIYLVAKSTDPTLFAAITDKYAESFSVRKGMEAVDAEELIDVIQGLGLPPEHPLLDLADSDALEDAAQGGIEGITKLRTHRKARGVSREELAQAKKIAEKNGRLGEEILNVWLEDQANAGVILGFCWDSNHNAIAPYDFSIYDGETAVRRIDAKSTSGDFNNRIHVSIAELNEMAHGCVPYDIYRLYNMKESKANLRIARDLKSFADEILGAFSSLPSGVAVDSISIDPSGLEFGEEILIDVSAAISD